MILGPPGIPPEGRRMLSKATTTVNRFISNREKTTPGLEKALGNIQNGATEGLRSQTLHNLNTFASFPPNLAILDCANMRR